MFALIYMTIWRLEAVRIDCSTMWNYYKIVNKEARGDRLCRLNLIYYGLWLFFNIAVTVVRCFALFYMFKSFRYLQKREFERKRKKLRRKEKKRRIKRERKKELMRLIMEQKNEQFKKQEELFKEMEQRNKQIQKEKDKGP